MVDTNDDYSNDWRSYFPTVEMRHDGVLHCQYVAQFETEYGWFQIDYVPYQEDEKLPVRNLYSRFTKRKIKIYYFKRFKHEWLYFMWPICTA